MGPADSVPEPGVIADFQKATDYSVAFLYLFSIADDLSLC